MRATWPTHSFLECVSQLLPKWTPFPTCGQREASEIGQDSKYCTPDLTALGFNCCSLTCCEVTRLTNCIRPRPSPSVYKGTINEAEAVYSPRRECKMNGSQSVIKVFLVNGESRSVRLDERMDVTVRGRERMEEGVLGRRESSFICIRCTVCEIPAPSSPCP